MPIPFTEFRLPRGERKEITVNRPHPIEALAQALTEAGCRFEIEILRTGTISMECLHGDTILSSALSPNGPEVLDHTDRMIREAHNLFFGIRN